jgi:hypothetical protein
VLSVREARFCRQCGALLRVDDPLWSADVSPDALTVELHEPKRQTTPLTSIEERTTGPQEVKQTGEVPIEEPLTPVLAAAPRATGGRWLVAASLLILVGLTGATIWRRNRHRTVPTTAVIVAQGAKADQSVPTDVPAKTSAPIATSDSGPTIAVSAPRTKQPGDQVNPRHRANDPASSKPPVDPDSSRPDDQYPPLVARNTVKTTGRSPDDSDVLYQRAANIVRGRDVKKLSRIELLQALQFYQNVKQGPNRSIAAREAERLGQEFDRRTWNH